MITDGKIGSGPGMVDIVSDWVNRPSSGKLPHHGDGTRGTNR